MITLYGVTEDGTSVPVQVTDDGKIIVHKDSSFEPGDDLVAGDIGCNNINASGSIKARQVEAQYGIKFGDDTVQITAATGGGGGGGGVEVETTNLANVQYFQEFTTVRVSSTSAVNVQNKSFSYTPVSDNSTLLIEYSFQGQIDNLTGNNTTITWQIGEDDAPISVGISQGAFDVGGGVGVKSSQSISCSVSNNSKATRNFSLMAAVNSDGQAGSRSYLTCIISEIVPERIKAGGGHI